MSLATSVGKIKVLIVDDSIVIRRMLTMALNEEPDITVSAFAPSGVLCLKKLEQSLPDVVTLDIEMPEMSGIETVREIRKKFPTLPVIMYSTLTERGAEATIDALAAGASDYAAKPSNVGNVTEGLRVIRSELAPKIRALCSRAGGGAAAPQARPETASPSHAAAEAEHFVRRSTRLSLAPRDPERLPMVKALVIGSSTGGPNALLEFMPALPADLPVPALIVQHMPPVFTKALAERLTAKSKIQVLEAEGGELLRPGRVYLAPGGRHLALTRRDDCVFTHLTDEPPENFCRPAVDVLFRSAVHAYGDGVLALVMTGMGADGFLGSEMIREQGGQVVVQDKETSVVWGMPGVIANAGLADAIRPISGLAAEVLARIMRGR